jgi:cytochrome P450
LRWETSVSVLLRNPVEDVELAGTVISRGTQLVVSVGSANHDEHRWPDPETWDIHRPRKPHLAFGTGPHQCLGMHLARLELTVALDAILERLPNLRADPDAPPPTVEGYPFRSPASLPVRFDPAPVAVPG